VVVVAHYTCYFEYVFHFLALFSAAKIRKIIDMMKIFFEWC
jgi:hypothetical protein